MKRLFLTIVLTMLPMHLLASCPSNVPSGVTSCFYADFVSGSDSNDGLSEAAGHPWKHLPGMTGCTGNCASNTPTAGYGYILKGGSVWTNASLPWFFNGTGTSSNPIYLGYDPAWNSGTVLSIRPTTSGYNCTAVSVGLSGGGGSSAAGTANFMSSGYLAGLLQHVTMTNAGSGYTSNPTVSFSGSSCTVNPTAVADIYSPVIDATGTIWNETNGAQGVFGPIEVYGPYITVDHLEFRGMIVDYTITPGSGSLSLLNQRNGNGNIYKNIYVHNFGTTNSQSTATATITAYSYSGGNLTLTSANTFIAGQPVLFSVTSGPTALNGVTLPVSATGLTTSSFEVATTLVSGSGSAVGTAAPQPSFNNTGGFQINEGSIGVVTVTNSFFDNYENEITSGNCGWNGTTPNAFSPPCGSSAGVQGAAVLTYNVVHDIRGQIYSNEQSGLNYSNNVIWGTVWDCCNQHQDTLYFFGEGVIANNVMHDVDLGGANFYIETCQGNPCTYGNTTYLYNNVGWNMGESTPPIGFSSEFWGTSTVSPSPKLYAYNNTFLSRGGTTDCINAGQWYGNSASSTLNFYLYNNHCISDQTGVHWYDANGGNYGTWNGQSNPNNSGTQAIIDAENVVMSPASASSQGYTISNQFAPTLSSNSTVTYSGTNFTSTSPGCGTSGLSTLCSDILGNSRPASGSWNAGAYQYSSGTNYSLTTSTTGTGSGTLSGANCSSGSYSSGTSVICVATATSGTFVGWTGTGSASGCTGTGSCSFTLAGNSTLTATFTLLDIERPTAIAPSTSTSIGCTGTNYAGVSTNTGLMYDTTNPPPNSTSGTLAASSLNTAGSTRWAGWQFNGWGSATGAYSALTLNVNLSCGSLYPGDGTGHCDVAYSLDAGTTWGTLTILSDTASQQTATVPIPMGTTLSNIYVGACEQASYDTINSAANTATATIWDIWTAGALTPTYYSLAVGTNGTGSGTVSGTNCTSTSYVSGTSVSCTATPTYGTFNGWSGTGSASGCSGTGACAFTLSSNSTVTATFTAPTTTTGAVVQGGVVAGGIIQ